jgi:hypothetical protein
MSTKAAAVTEKQQQDFAPSEENFEWVHAIASGHWASQAMRAAVQLSLPEHLAESRLTAAEVAEREGSDPDATFRLMRACVALRLLIADNLGRFYGTPMLAALRGDIPGSLRGYVLDVTMPSQCLAFTTLTETVLQGRCPTESAPGSDFSAHPRGRPEEREFPEDSGSFTNTLLGDIAMLVETARVAVAVGVGGASGSLLYLLMEKDPTMRGIVLERPDLLAPAVAERDSRGLGNRVDVVGGDFVEVLPPADLYLLTFALRGWDDKTCVRILRRCREAMHPGGRVAVVELIVGEITDPGPAALLDLNRLATAPGRERSLAEYDALFRAAGLRRTSLVSASQPLYSVIEATAS